VRRARLRVKSHTGFVPIVVAFLLLLSRVASAAHHEVLACVGAKVYPSPTAVPLEDAVLVIEDGKIQALTPRGGGHRDVPGSAVKLDCTGKFVVAGFWNSHVHFENGWAHAATAPASELETHLQEMLTRWGFTTVWDLGSETGNTLALRARVDSGEVPGPRILMAGNMFPKNGHPVYLPPEMQLPEAATPGAARQLAERYMGLGLDGVKLFTGAYMGARPVINMDSAIVQAAVKVAHAHDKPVFAHPQNHIGVDNALAGGVDILAHTIPTEGSFTEAELQRMKQQHTALIPTLSLWTTVVEDRAAAAGLVQAGANELKSYFSNGGTILFGTDVGFTTKYDTGQEYEFMARAMGWSDILASLTTNPSRFFEAATKGRIEKGMDADPATDVRNLSKVAYTIRGGRIIYRE